MLFIGTYMPKYTFLCSFLLLPVLFSACGGRKVSKSDPDYVPAKVRKERRKQKRIVANYKVKFNDLKARYAYEERMLGLLDKKDLQVAEREEMLKKELKKIIMLK